MKNIEQFQKKLRVLFVEDNKEAQENIRDLMSNFFDYIVTAYDGSEGLKKFKKDEFDVVITDINMPVMNGIEMIKHIREIDQNVIIVVLTAHQESKYLLDSINYSVDSYILKPIDFRIFKNVVNKISNILYNAKKTQDHEKHLEQLVYAKNEELKRLVNKDPMTNLYNRRYFNSISKILISLAKREKQNLSALMIDIDRFKVINDNYGHIVGDQIIKLVSNILLKRIRNSDIAVRFGGEEFVILLPNTNINGATKIATQISEEIKKEYYKTKNNEIIKFTASIGVAAYDFENDLDIDNLIHRSDEALYEAKKAGRNKVVIYKKKTI